MEIKFTILGEPASKANSRRLVKSGSRPAIIKSSKALDYEKTALIQIPGYAKMMFECDLSITINVFYASRRPDLDCSVLFDLLQARFEVVNGVCECVRKGVYLNDRALKEMHLYHHIDKANPRAEIALKTIDG